MKLVRIKKSFGRKKWGCPRTRSRTNWCYRMCVPHDGTGDCGRLAPHAFLGRTQTAILRHKVRAEMVKPTG